MIGRKKKGLAAIIIDSAKPKVAEGDDYTEKPKEEEAESEVDPGLEVGAEELIEAVKADDAKSVARTIQSMFSMCQGLEEAPEEEMGEGSEEEV